MQRYHIWKTVKSPHTHTHKLKLINKFSEVIEQKINIQKVSFFYINNKRWERNQENIFIYNIIKINK